MGGEESLKSAEIICPISDDACDIVVDGINSMGGMIIENVNGWNGLSLTCLNPPCTDISADAPRLFCDTNSSSVCSFKRASSTSETEITEWQCFNPHHECNYRETTTPPINDSTGDSTLDPTLDPTLQPSRNPTASPSESPTNAPTRFPTSPSDYDAFIDISYNLAGLDDRLITMMTYDFSDTLVDIKRMVEKGYVEHQSNWVLNYYEFDINI